MVQIILLLFYHCDYKSEIVHHIVQIQHCHNVQPAWSSYFAFTIWVTWNTRNKICFQSTPISIKGQLASINHSSIEFSYLAIATHCSQQHTTFKLIRWIPPTLGRRKLSTNGIVNLQANCTGIGGMFRDSCGRWVLDFIQYVGAITSLVAEFKAIRMGLQIAWNQGVWDIDLESNSQLSTLMLYDLHCISPRLFPLIFDCRMLLAHKWDVRVTHILREANFVADGLAKKALASDGTLHMFPLFPLLYPF